MDTRTATADLPDELKSLLSPVEQLTEAAAIAEARDDEDALQQVSDEMVDLLAADDPEAVAVYEQHQAAQIGERPLAKGAQDWPAALSVRRGPTITVSPRSPVYGWRGWQVEGDRLLAPFNTVKGGLPADAPGHRLGPGHQHKLDGSLRAVDGGGGEAAAEQGQEEAQASRSAASARVSPRGGTSEWRRQGRHR